MNWGFNMGLSKIVSVQKRIDGRLFILLPKVIVELFDIKPQSKLEITLKGKELKIKKVPEVGRPQE